MRTRLTALLVTLVPIGLAPIAALAAECDDYQLSQEQIDYIAQQDLQVAPPEGEVPVVQRCDVDGNNAVDINDIRAIARARNQPAAHPDDPMDWDRNNVINILDARGCQRACALPRCAVQAEDPDEMMGGVTEVAQCSQVDDFDGDGKQDFVALNEDTGGNRGGGWTLEVVILTEDAAGNVQHAIFPYSGQKSDTDEITQHLSKQPAGAVDLNPGMIMTDEPAIVSYRNGEPDVLYYYVDGELARAFYGVDD